MPSNWTYSDFESQSTNTLRLQYIRLHIAEVEDAITATVGADGKSRDAGVLEAKLARLTARRRELESMPDANGATNNGVSYAKIRSLRGGSH